MFTGKRDALLKAVDGVDLDVQPGEFVAILGQNGSGKTTLVKHLNGILTPTIGDIRLGGRSLRGQPSTALSRHVGLVFQNPDHQIFAERVWDEVAFGPRLQGLAEGEVARRVEEALAAVDLAGSGDLDPFILTKGGRQRVAVASTLATQPEVIILDEPTMGLSLKETAKLVNFVRGIKEAGKSSIFIDHNVVHVYNVADRIVVIDRGRIAAPPMFVKLPPAVPLLIQFVTLPNVFVWQLMAA
jgi:energy-coupling factor transport system ATP-binding protein